MDNTRKIIIIALVAVIAVLSGLIAMNFMSEPVKTVELFENGTTIEVPQTTNLASHDEFSTVYTTSKGTSVMGVDNNNLAGALATKILSEVIVDKGEMQDNGLYKLDKKSIMEIGDQLGEGYDKNNIKEAFVAIKHNNTVNQTVLVIGEDESEILSIAESIHWKMGAQTVKATVESSGSSKVSSDDKTFPFYADDGSIVGYYHVGDVVQHYDGLYQLKSNGEWVYIGEAPGSSEAAYNQGYSDAVDDSASGDDADYDDENSDEESGEE